MGVNQRKNKQAAVPSLEETLPRKFKSEKVVKGKKNGSVKDRKPSNNAAAKITKANVTNRAPVVDFEEEPVQDQDGDEEAEADFGAVKASLFEDDEDEQDEFEELGDQSGLYCHLLRRLYQRPGCFFSR